MYHQMCSLAFSSTSDRLTDIFGPNDKFRGLRAEPLVGTQGSETKEYNFARILHSEEVNWNENGTKLFVK